MTNGFQRTELLLGADALKKLKESRVAVFGLGGVGGYVVEALARCGTGALELFDNDTVDETNINRQILATTETIGQRKTSAAKQRVLSINPECSVEAHDVFILPGTVSEFDFSDYDYVVDAIDTVTGKIAIIESAFRSSTPVISCMGTGNKLDPSALEIADLAETSFDPLARIMRKELRKRGIEHLKVLCSREKAKTPKINLRGENGRRSVPGSVSFVPSVAGLIIAGEVIKDLIGYNRP